MLAASNASIMALPLVWRDGRKATDRGVQVRCDRNGAFAFNSLPPNDYVVVARSGIPKEANTRLADRRLKYGATFYPSTLDLDHAERVSIRPGEDATNLDILVLPEETVSVTGRVVDASGKPAVRALVSLGWNPVNPGAGRRPSQETFTDANGFFAFDAAPDVYRLDVVMPSRTPPPAGTDVIMTNPDGQPIYILPDSPRHSEDVEVRAPGLTLRVVLRQP